MPTRLTFRPGLILWALFLLILFCAPARAQEFKVAADAPVKIEADSLAYDSARDLYTAEGDVVITYAAGTLSAASVAYDRKSNSAKAEGGAFLKMDEDYLQGERIEVNVENKTGVAYNAKAFYARNHFYIQAAKIEKTGENTYRMEAPSATTCDGESPDWQLRGSRMGVTVEGYGWVTHARLLIKGVPVFYTPIIAFPAKTKRQTGFLFPYLAYSRNKDGFDIELPFFWAISPQTDATLYSRYIEKRGYKQGAEFRFTAGNRFYGTLYGDFLEDTKHITESIDAGLSRDWQETRRRWSYAINTQAAFDPEFYIRTDLHKVSDAWYFRDFNAHNYYLSHAADTDDDPFKRISFTGNESLRFLESQARLFKGWNNVNVIARASSVDDFSQVYNDRTLQKYPEVLLTGIRQPVFSTPLYAAFTGTYDYFYRREGDRGHYIDVAPTLSLPLKLSNYAIMTPYLTARETYWQRDDEQAVAGEKSSERTSFNAGVSLGSRLSRVFNVRILGWDKLRHDIRPEILYAYSPAVRDGNLPDYLPRLGSLLETFVSSTAAPASAFPEQNAVAWALTQTLTARKPTLEASEYLDIMRFKVYSAYDIGQAGKDWTGEGAERRPLSNFGLELDVRPHPYLSFSARNKYSVYNGWKEMNYDLGLSDSRGDRLSVGYRYTLDAIEEINLGLKAVITNRFSASFGARLDLFNDRNVETSAGLLFMEQCWGVGVDYVKTHDDERVMLKLSLTGLGMFGI